MTSPRNEELAADRRAAHAVEELYVRRRAVLERYARFRRGCSEEDARDAVSEAMLRMVQRGKSLGPRQDELKLRDYVKRFATRASARNKRQAAPADLDSMTSALASPEDLAVASDLMRAVMSAVATLPVPLRSVWTLVSLEGISVEDVAVLSGKSTKTIANRVAMARRALRKSLSAFVDSAKSPRGRGHRQAGRQAGNEAATMILAFIVDFGVGTPGCAG